MQTRQAIAFRPDRSQSNSTTTVLASLTVEKTTTASSKKRTRRQCSRTDCIKVDAGRGFCVAHGGGKKCLFPGCPKGYQTGGFCRQHGGGARCQVGGCNKVDAGKGLCRAHGGGKRCQIANCPKADVGGGFCTAHGGGRRCLELGCSKIDQGGGKCRAHGGARRCRRRSCQQPARGASGLCTEHGGACVCSVLSCRRLVRSPHETGTMCVMCSRSQKQKGGIMHKQQNHKNSLDDRRRHSAVPTRKGSEALSLTSLVPMSRSPATVRCDGSQVANCLDNGCSRSYGGECNCVAGCTCNGPTLQPPTQMAPMVGCSNVITRIATSTGSTMRSSVSELKYVSQSTSSSTPRPTLISRIVLQLKPYSTSIGFEAIIAILSTISGVRSVHLIQESSLRAMSPEYDSERDNVAGDSRPHDILSSRLIAVRGRPVMDLETSLAPLEHLQIAEVNIIEQSTSVWTRKEVVLRVPDMMCPANCGTSVLNAVRALNGVEAARLHFQKRRLVVRGDMDVDAIRGALRDIGFDSNIDAETPLPRRFRFSVDDLSDVGLNGVKLKDTLEAVEGVENVVLLTDRIEVLVVAMLLNSRPLLQATKRIGFEMLELSEEAWGIPLEVAPHTLESLEDEKSNPFNEHYHSHKCDMRICPQIGCSRYMTTVAHTAALAVGWSVPGCGMASGGECTCGDGCKCVGCPEHNPVS